MKTIRVILVEDHFLVRLGLRSMFETITDDTKIEIVAEAATVAEFEEIMRGNTETDLVILDIRLPDGSGIDIAKKIISERPEWKILILSAENDEKTITEITSINVGGFVGKGSSPKEIKRAIDNIYEGYTFYGKEISALLHAVRTSKPEVSDINFTPTEQIVIKLCSEGLIAKEIAAKLNISDKTVSVHKTNIFKKLGINSTMELVAYASKTGLIN